jgi:uncharacterized protein involved in type VI secretion and phage assembly
MYDESPDPQFLSVYDGVVTDRNDPFKVGRVRIRVPGLIEFPGVWALPMGMPGAGSATKGFFFVPEEGAEVSVFFKQGDVDHPRYLAGAWGRPNGNPELPSSALTAEDGTAYSKEEIPNVTVLETRRYEIVIDDNEGHERLAIRDKQSPDEDIIEIDSVNNGIRIKGTTAVRIESTGVVNLEGLQVIINGRVVRETGDPI